MSIPLRQSTATVLKLGPFVSSSDGVTAQSALTLTKADVRLSKNGGNMAAANADQGESDAGAAHDELGYYDISLDATDTGTLGRLKVMISESGALPVWADCEVMPANVWDALYGADKLQVDRVEIGGASATAAPPTAAEIRAEVDSNSTQLAAIVADTNELQADWADGGRLDLIVDNLTDVAEADEVIDKTTDPDQWKLLKRQRGTATTLLTKNLKDVDGAAITGIDTVVGQAVQP